MPGWDETENEWRYRLREPGLFSKFRYKEITDGVSIIYGKLKAGAGWAAQALRFAKDKFDKASAQKWYSAHPDIGKSEAENWEDASASMNIKNIEWEDMGDYVKFKNIPIAASGIINGALRSPEELDKAIPFMGSLRILMGHPPELEPDAVAATNMIDPRYPVIGWTSDPRKGPDMDGRARGFTDLNIKKKDASGNDRVPDIESMKSGGLQELSIGYFRNIQLKSGEINGQRYSMVETNINPYHLALLKDRPAAVRPPILGIGCNSSQKIGDGKMADGDQEPGTPPKPAAPAPETGLNELKAQVSALAKEKEENAKKAKELEEKLKAAEAKSSEGEKARAELAALRAEERKKKVEAIKGAYGEERFAKLFPEEVLKSLPEGELERHFALASEMAEAPPEAGTNERRTFFALKGKPSAGKNERSLPPHKKGLTVAPIYRPTVARRILGSADLADKEGKAA